MRKIDLKTLLSTPRKERFVLTCTLYNIICTWFFVGKFPKLPGTIGSLATYPIFYLVLINSSSFNSAKQSFLIIATILFAISLWAISKFQSVTKTQDHSYIVIDEVIGQLLTIYLALDEIFYLADIIYINLNYSFLAFLIAMIPFRFFDIAKPLMIGWINDKMKGTLGVILDDVLAAIFAAFSLKFIIYLLKIFNITSF